MARLLTLLFNFIKIGFLSFGGGYSMIPLIQNVIEKYHWITTKDFFSMIGIAEMTPGSLSINSATFVGYNVFGFLGSLVSTLGVILPSFLFAILLSRLMKNKRFNKFIDHILYFIKPIVIAMIISAAYCIGKETYGNGQIISIENCFTALISILAMYLIFKKNLNPITIILVSGFLGIFLFYIL